MNGSSRQWRLASPGWLRARIVAAAALAVCAALTACERAPTAPAAAAPASITNSPAPHAGQPASEPAASAPAAVRKPSIMIFLLDTVRSERLNCYGYTRHTTSPQIDALAGEGVLFEQAYSPGPWTLPTVVSLMTGKPLCEHQTLAPRETMAPELETLAQRLHAVGYTTVGLYANSMVSPRYGLERGYDLYQASTRNDAEKVRAALSLQPGDPFFLYVHNLEPHNPYHFAPPSTPGFPNVGMRERAAMQRAYKGYRKASRIDYMNERPLGAGHMSEEMTRHMAALDSMRDDYSSLYDATLLLSDRMFGSIVAELKARGLWDDMLIIFLSDHGEEFGEHGSWLHDQSVYEEMVRVPLIIKFPKGEFAGRRVSDPVSLLDVLPTLASYMEYGGLAHGARGDDLMPLVRGESARPVGWRVVSMRHNRERYYEPWKKSRGDINIALRKPDRTDPSAPPIEWKAIWNVELDTVELYDLAADPGERDNLSDRRPDVAAEAREAAHAWYETCRGAQQDARENRTELAAEEVQNLQQIGYLGGGDDDDEAESQPAPHAEPDDILEP